MGTADRGGPACLRAAMARLAGPDRRPYVAAYGYLLCGFDALHRLGPFNRLALASRVFGREAMDRAPARIAAKLEGWGYRSARTDHGYEPFSRSCSSLIAARARGPDHQVFQRLRNDPRLGRRRSTIPCRPRAMAGMGFASRQTRPTRDDRCRCKAPLQIGLPGSIVGLRHRPLDSGGPARAPQHPGHGRAMACSVTARSHVADGLDSRNLRRLGRTGDTREHRRFRAAAGRPRRSPRTPPRAHDYGQLRDGDAHVLSRLPGVGLVRPALRSPTALATPRSVRALVGPKPRVIADDVWAKILWAGLNLIVDDLAPPASALIPSSSFMRSR